METAVPEKQNHRVERPLNGKSSVLKSKELNS
jgi:hypothetical protein